PPPVAPPAPPPVAPPTPQPEAPPAPSGPPEGFALGNLHAQDSARLTEAQIEAAAQRLSVEAKVIRSLVKVESASVGFAADGRPLLSFEPYWFSQLTGGRFDASHPGISQPTNRAYLGGNQASRWTKLAEAYALDADAALGAASWGAFQLPGRYYDDAGYGSVFAFVQDMAQSETRQLAAFEAYARRKELIDELQRRDWTEFAKAFEGEAGAAPYAAALASAYATLSPPADPYLDALFAQSRDHLTRADYEAVAAQLGCEVEAIQAVAEVEVGGHSAFSANGRPTILFEPHIFSGRTNHQHDASHPNVSYRSWDASRYPRTQDGRYAQLREAYALNPEVAAASASWGMFQVMGFNHAACGFATAKDFVADMAKSEARQLAAFAGFVRHNNLADDLARLDWAGFARGYNGPGYAANRYDVRMAEAYARLKGVA
ncbi:MAG: N-acetylmuramidase domain-containing protein, partial [Terricaulis sp.]